MYTDKLTIDEHSQWRAFLVIDPFNGKLLYKGVDKLDNIITLRNVRVFAPYDPKKRYGLVLGAPRPSRTDAHNDMRGLCEEMNYDPIEVPEWRRLETTMLYGGGGWILCDQTGGMWKTQLEAATANNVSQGNISNHLRGKIKHCNGLTFQRITAAERARRLAASAGA